MTDKKTKNIMRKAAEQAMRPKKTAKEILDSQAKASKVTKGKGDTNCAKGKILRSAYFTASGKAVPAKCIQDKGGEGKGLYGKDGKRIVIPLREGRLAQYGYFDVTKKTQNQRREALRKAMMGEKDWLSVFRRLIYTSTLTKNTDPARSAIFYKDAYWLKATFRPSTGTK